MRIVIIEDEKLTAKDLARTLKAVRPDVDIVTMLHSVEDAIDFFQQEVSVDLIFSDIQLGDGLSFEIFKQTDLQIPIIYCTAFNDYALEAFKTLGIDYLVKPFSKETVEKALTKYLSLKGAVSDPEPSYSELMKLLQHQAGSKKLPAVLVQKRDKIIPLPAEEIAVFFIEDDAVFAFTFGGKKQLLSHKLNDLEQRYQPHFFRANRQYLVHRKAVKDVSHHFNRKILVNLTVAFEPQILVGKVKVTAFLDWLANT